MAYSAKPPETPAMLAATPTTSNDGEGKFCASMLFERIEVFWNECPAMTPNVKSPQVLS